MVNDQQVVYKASDFFQIPEDKDRMKHMLKQSFIMINNNLWVIDCLESNEKAMREFINIAAHELRTPIQPILGSSEVLQDTKSSLN